MINLIAAIKNRFDSNAALANVFGQLYLEEAPDVNVLPLAVANIVSVLPEYQTGSLEVGSWYTEESQVQFTLFSADGDEAMRGVQGLINLFDHVEFDISGENLLASFKKTERTHKVDRKVWQCMVVFQFRVSRPKVAP
jgi:hypothetical protein